VNARITAFDLPSYPERLTRSLALCGHPQMALRLWYGHRGAATTRRDADDVLTIKPVLDSN
jgi:hypothetical protein